MIPSPQIIQELKDYIATDTGKTEAAPGCHDDSVIALAICAEVMRTHWDRLNTQNVSWRQKIGDHQADDTYWILYKSLQKIRVSTCPHAAVASSGEATNSHQNPREGRMRFIQEDFTPKPEKDKKEKPRELVASPLLATAA